MKASERPDALVAYRPSSDGWRGFAPLVRALAKEPGVRRVCELGGGANPLLARFFVERRGIEYTIVDISAAELAKAPEGYRTVCADASGAEPLPAELAGAFDLVFSRMMLEHVANPAGLHRNVLGLLALGGVAVHFFPTLYAPPFLLNWLLPDGLSGSLLRRAQSKRGSSGRHGKFPAYYHDCRGPSVSRIRRLESLGYRVAGYIGFFGHSGAVAGGEGYYDCCPPACRLHEAFSRLLVRCPASWLTSYAYLVLARSDCSGDRLVRVRHLLADSLSLGDVPHPLLRDDRARALGRDAA